MKLVIVCFYVLIVCLSCTNENNKSNNLNLKPIALIDTIGNDTLPVNDKLFGDIKMVIICDTVGKNFSSDINSVLEVLKYYKIVVPKFKYSYIEKLYYEEGSGVYDNFILSNDKMKLLATSFNRNMTPIFLIRYYDKNNKVDSVYYHFINGKLVPN